jgi:sec-independent protein translocase protein TatA
MGVGGISFWQLLIILIIVLLLFGTNRLRNLGSDLGEAIKGFRNAMHEGEEGKDKLEQKPSEKVVNDEESHRDKV